MGKLWGMEVREVLGDGGFWFLMLRESLGFGGV